MKRLFNLVLIFAFFTITSPLSFSQEGEDNLVSISLTQTSDTLTSRTNQNIFIKINLNKGWHVNSNQPVEDFLIPTKLSINSAANIIVVDTLYPKPVLLQSDISEQPASVFNDGSIITCKLAIPADCKEKEIKISFELQYQACNNKTCSPPGTTSLEKTFVINNKQK